MKKCGIIPEKSCMGFWPMCVDAQYQACPPISRPPPSTTKFWIISASMSVYAVHTNTLSSVLKFVFLHVNPKLDKGLMCGSNPTTPFLSWSSQFNAFFQNDASFY